MLTIGKIKKLARSLANGRVRVRLTLLANDTGEKINYGMEKYQRLIQSRYKRDKK